MYLNFTIVYFQSHFVRHNTPHPKELKARHQKFLQKEKQMDGGAHLIGNQEHAGEKVSVFDILE